MESQSKHARENACYKYGVKGHWSRTYRTPKHLVNLYQTSIKAKGKEVETNYINGGGSINITHLDVSDFFFRISVEKLTI